RSKEWPAKRFTPGSNPSFTRWGRLPWSPAWVGFSPGTWRACSSTRERRETTLPMPLRRPRKTSLGARRSEGASRAHADPNLAVVVALLFPARRGGLDRVEGVLAGAEGSPPMRRSGGDHHRQLARLQGSSAVDDRHA